ncbi:hypothetical protein [Streptomyces sp. NPDC006510]|uniref:hypothetical protein n=1 Tax=Streptomyces sp. NPDC006510 TaxID=3155600 RepID=UPI0033BECA0B
MRRARGERSMLDTGDAHVSPETLRKIETGRVATPAFPAIAAIADVPGQYGTAPGTASSSSSRPGPMRRA